MPNIKSAKKRVLVTKTKTLKNQMFKSALKTTLKNFDTAVNEQDKQNLELSYKNAVKKIDKAVAKGIMHKNTAARKKSSLTLKANSLNA